MTYYYYRSVSLLAEGVGVGDVDEGGVGAGVDHISECARWAAGVCVVVVVGAGVIVVSAAVVVVDSVKGRCCGGSLARGLKP